ncbi:hypothetical protein RBSH_00820 [Rhodopirellula baltica SH28]|uniref:Uncharacterized protein n=1 Tax=Rhodopirellula baltica SH28 TaxID=993517 RepID=K5DMG9_RHOBT|nr:hypothetical protein RBSH_00820 [Rhodopirellula baltica SH28]
MRAPGSAHPQLAGFQSTQTQSAAQRFGPSGGEMVEGTGSGDSLFVCTG